MKVIDIENRFYPKNLRNICDPPQKLYVIGDEGILNDFSIGIVGTRRCTFYGEHITKSLAYNLAKYDVNIISGMAKGIDTCAHTGCLMAKGKTIAVLRKRF